MADNITPRLKTEYRDKIAPELMKELGVKNIHDLPRLAKIIVASGTGRNKDDKRHQEIVGVTLAKITGQAPINRIAKKSIASFKIRKGMGAPLGQMVTLRGDRMYEFLDRLVNVAMPRIRDFHGVSAKAFDGQGNYTLGIVEQSIFPELSFEDTAVLHGLQITFVIKNQDAGHSRALLEKFGIPFEKDVKGGK
jgi:large subunit ribosomal protein L5